MSYRVRCISQIVKLWPAVSDKLYIAHAHIYDLKSGNRTNPRFSTSSMISVLSRRKLKSAFFMTRKIYQCKILRNDSNTIFSIISFCQLNEFVVVISFNSVLVHLMLWPGNDPRDTGNLLIVLTKELKKNYIQNIVQICFLFLVMIWHCIN